MHGSDTKSIIGPGSVVVKSGDLTKPTKTQSPSGYNAVFRSCRPDVLSKLPRSCNLLFDLMRAAIDPSGLVTVSIRELGQLARLSHTQARRALRRLQGAHLIEMVDPGSGPHPATWKVLWRSYGGSFPQVSGTLAPIRNRTRDLRDFSPKGTPSPVDQQPTPSKRALAWAMAVVRKELSSYPIDTARKRLICTSVGSSLWQRMNRGEVHAGPELGAVVSDLIAWLRDARGIGEGLRSWCSWAGWAVRGVLEDRRRAETERIASERLIEQIRQEREDAKGGLQRFLSEAGVGSLSAYIQALGLREAHAKVSSLDGLLGG